MEVRHVLDPVEYDGVLDLAELEVEGLDELMRPAGPLRYHFVVERHEQGVLLQGELEWVFECECARCLKPFRHVIRLDSWTNLLPFEGEEAVEFVNDCVDLTPYLREDMVLELPQRPLCRADCGGLQEATTSSAPEAKPDRNWGEGQAAWQALDKLKIS
jgi:uncharacterized protein